MDEPDARGSSRSIKGSLGAAAVILALDVGVFGSLLFATLLCPIWMLVSLLRSAFYRPGWGLATTRVLIPAVTFLLVRANDSFQRGMAEANAQRIVAACEAYQDDNGSLPPRLDDLVPQYLSKVPAAKYCLDPSSSQFNYFCKSSMLIWYVVPPYLRKIYSFEERRWSYLD